MVDSRTAKREALQTDATLATVIHAIIKKQYGSEVYDWDPLTVYLEVQSDFDAQMAAAVTDRWSAIQVIMTSDAFFKKIEAFLAVCNTLASGTPFFGVFDPVTSEEAAWAIAEVSLNREILPFSYTIQAYMKATLASDGYSSVSTYPEIFQPIFGDTSAAVDVKDGIAALSNNDTIEIFVDDQLKDLAYQFGKIPDLGKVDDLLLDQERDITLAELELHR